MFKVLGLLLAFNYLAQGAYYIGVNDYADWDTAKSRCESSIYVKIEGGRLATWNDYATYEDKVVQAAKFGGNPHGSWVGLTDKYGEGKWSFSDGDATYCGPAPHDDCDRLDEWTVGQPDDWGHSEDCAHVWVDAAIDRKGNGYGLNDNSCAAQLSYVCEFDDFQPANLIREGKYMSEQPGPIDIPFQEPDNKNTYYILEFASTKDIIIIASILLNVITITMICYLGSKASCKKRSSAYSKVNMYSTEDEKL